jgi:dienelactone hydrolase
MTQDNPQLGIYSDWIAEAHRQRALFPVAPPGAETQRRVRDVLGFTSGPEQPREPRVERRWERDGLCGEVVSWATGYGPRTQAWVLKPAGATGALPGVVALHDHGGFKYYGKEKIADGPDGPLPALRDHRAEYYEGRAFAGELARRGFTVIAHDTFLWSSRRFPLETMPASTRATAAATLQADHAVHAEGPEIAAYNIAAAHHEHLIAKYCNLLGTSMAGMVAHEDRIALNYLRSRPDVVAERIGCVGLSGGGNRAVLLQATHDQVAAAVVVGQMTTYAQIMDRLVNHSWMMQPFGWTRYGDWPDIAACRAPSPLLVQNALDDGLFTEAGMREAHERLVAHYASARAPGNYVGEFYPGPHRFDIAMQERAFDWLGQQLASQRIGA